MKSICTKLLFALLIIAGTTGCARKSGTSGSSDEVQRSLKLGAMSSMDYIPFVVAEEMGYCDSLGLDLEIVKFFSANDRDAAFRAGSVDGTVIDYTGAALQHAHGVPLALVMKHDGLFYMMARPEIADLSGLSGRKVAISRNTVIEYSTDLMLSMGDNPVSGREEKVEINKIPVRMQMLLEGEVDASIFPQPFAGMAEAQGMNTLMTTRELGIEITGTIFGTEAIEHKREAIELLIRAYNMGVEYINTHPREMWMHLLVEQAGVPQGMEATIPLPTYTPAKKPDPNTMSMVVKWLKDRSLVPQDYEAEGLVDDSLL